MTVGCMFFDVNPDLSSSLRGAIKPTAESKSPAVKFEKIKLEPASIETADRKSSS